MYKQNQNKQTKNESRYRCFEEGANKYRISPTHKKEMMTKITLNEKKE